MALYRTMVKGDGGGQMTETVLWTNPDPTSPSTGYLGGNVSLSDDINNYDYICFEFCQNMTNTSNRMKVYYKVDEFKTVTGTTTGKFFCTMSIIYSSTWRASRYVSFTSNTQVNFTQCFNYSNSAVDRANTSVIPTNIYGCK